MDTRTEILGFRLPIDIKNALRERARADSRTLTSLLIHICRRYLAEQKALNSKDCDRAA